MSLISSQGIKRAIAREGLIILGLSIILYFLVSVFLQDVPVILPRYRLEFVGGEVYTINIFPEIRNRPNYRAFLEEVYSPSPKLIERRINEFVKAAHIKSILKSSSYINARQIYLSRLYSRLMGVTFFLKLFIIYLILLFLRFIIWAIKISTNHSLRR